MKLSVLKGSIISLKTMKEDILPKLQNWLLDSEINKFLDDSECNLSIDELKKIFPFENDKKNNVLFTIIYNNDNLAIGICGLQKIDYNRKDAYLRIIIGNRKFWDGRTALESEKLLLKFAFQELKLNKVYSIINVKNLGQCNLVEILGMKKDGVLRDYIVQNRNFYDAFLYSVLEKEF